MSISQAELLEALKGLNPEQLAGIIAQGAGRSPMKPRQLHDLRPLPTADDPRPTFFVSQPDRSIPITHNPFPRLLWHVESGQEITVMNQAEMDAKGTLYTATPPDSRPLDPVEALRQQFDALSDDDKAFVIEVQRKARLDAVTKQMGGLNAAQLANALGESTKKARK